MNRLPCPTFAAALSAAIGLAAPAAALTVTDPVGDFLPSFSGTQAGRLDITGAAAIRGTTGVNFTVRTAGAIGSTPGLLYVWGINRGAGTPRLTFGSPSIGAGIQFDSVFVMFGNGDARLVTFPAAGAPTITNFAGALTVSGNRISGFAPFALLPSRGFAAEDYVYSLWSRQRVNPTVDGLNSEIADLLPGTGGFAAAVPEPASWAMLIAGFGLAGAVQRRRRLAVTA